MEQQLYITKEKLIEKADFIKSEAFEVHKGTPKNNEILKADIDEMFDAILIHHDEYSENEANFPVELEDLFERDYGMVLAVEDEEYLDRFVNNADKADTYIAFALEEYHRGILESRDDIPLLHRQAYHEWATDIETAIIHAVRSIC